MRCRLVVLLALPGAVAAQTGRPAALTRIDSIVTAELARNHVPGASVAVVSRGEVIVAKGYGLANVETGTATSAETIYRIGSLTKQFTALGIMQLVEQGKIGLDEAITRYLPDFPTQGHKVTIRHLLTHTSGIHNYTALGPKVWNETFRLDQTSDQMIALFKDVPFDFNPGEQYSYSNSAFYLLGVVIEKVSGLPYPRYLKERILEPLGLRSTSYCDNQAIVPHRSQGYELSGTDVVNSAPISMTTPGAAGAICSTVLDLAAWQRGFNEAKRIKPASRDAMRTPATLNSGKKTSYGFGLGVGEFEGHQLVNHSGGVNGFISWLGNFPNDDLIIAVLTNTGSGPAPRIGQLIARVMLEIPLPVVKDLAIDAAERAQALGTYDLGPVKLIVRQVGDRLEAQLGPQPPTRLLSQGSGVYRAERDSDIVVRFRTSKGASEVVVEIQGSTLQGVKQP